METGVHGPQDVEQEVREATKSLYLLMRMAYYSFFCCCCWVSLHVTWIFPEIFSLILIMWPCLILGFPGGSLPRWPTCQCRRRGLDLWNGKIPWRRKGQPTPAFLPGEFHGQRNLAGYSPCGHKWVRHDLVTKQQQLHPFGLAY